MTDVLENKNYEIKYMDAGDSCIHLMLGDEISVEMHERVKTLYRRLNRRHIRGIREVVPAYRSVSVYYDPLSISHKELIAWIMKVKDERTKENETDNIRRIRIPVLFGGEEGPDLSRVASLHHMTEEEVVERFCAQDFLNHFVGFMPGKPYLGGLPAELETPRLEVPRLKVPSGTVVLFGKQAGIFGVEQPSGANCLGRSPIRIYDQRKEMPTLFQMGDYVRFYPVTKEAYSRLEEEVEAMTYLEEIEFLKGGGADE